MCGLLIRAERKAELGEALGRIKAVLNVSPDATLHFRDLDLQQQIRVIEEISKLEIGLVAVVSNKRNMKKYRNRRVEAKSFEIIRNRIKPKKINWLYNHMFRYLLERASAECERRSHRYFGEIRPIKIVFAHRSNFQYSQTQSYLHWM
jgi:hypothetical protein